MHGRSSFDEQVVLRIREPSHIRRQRDPSGSLLGTGFDDRFMLLRIVGFNESLRIEENCRDIAGKFI